MRIKSIFIKNIYFAAYLTVMSVVAAPLAVPSHVAVYVSKYFVYGAFCLNYLTLLSNLRNLFVPIHCRHVSGRVVNYFMLHTTKSVFSQRIYFMLQ